MMTKNEGSDEWDIKMARDSSSGRWEFILVDCRWRARLVKSRSQERVLDLNILDRGSLEFTLEAALQPVASDQILLIRSSDNSPVIEEGGRLQAGPGKGLF